MNRRFFANLGLLTLLAAGSAQAQPAAVADIPFTFHVGKSVLPAGQYTVGILSLGSAVLTVRCLACQGAAMVQTFPAHITKYQAKGTLAFRRYGSAYFLATVSAPWTDREYGLFQSKRERKIATSGPTFQTMAVALATR